MTQSKTLVLLLVRIRSLMDFSVRTIYVCYKLSTLKRLRKSSWKNWHLAEHKKFEDIQVYVRILFEGFLFNPFHHTGSKWIVTRIEVVDVNRFWSHSIWGQDFGSEYNLHFRSYLCEIETNLVSINLVIPCNSIKL